MSNDRVLVESRYITKGEEVWLQYRVDGGKWQEKKTAYKEVPYVQFRYFPTEEWAEKEKALKKAGKDE